MKELEQINRIKAPDLLANIELKIKAAENNLNAFQTTTVLGLLGLVLWLNIATVYNNNLQANQSDIETISTSMGLEAANDFYYE